MQARRIKGAKNASKKDKEIWNEFFNDWEILSIESEMLLISKQQSKTTELIFPEKEGKEVERTVRTRLNQSFFRSMLLASYNNKCCITGISTSEFLVASHIVPWAIDKNNRLNPRNGILINALHDKAFEYGYITITSDYNILVCNELLNSKETSNDEYFKKIHNQELILPSRFLPDTEFIKYHNHEKFRG